MGWFWVTLGVAFCSAVVPLLNVELFVLGVAATNPGAPWFFLGAAVALGQVAGKLLYYLAARGSIQLPAFLHDRIHAAPKPTPRREAWRARTKGIRTRMSALLDQCRQHRHWMAATYGVSAVVGLPPYMAMTVLAGLTGMPVPMFLATGLAGRFIRFSVLAAAPAVFVSWLRW